MLGKAVAATVAHARVMGGVVQKKGTELAGYFGSSFSAPPCVQLRARRTSAQRVRTRTGAAHPPATSTRAVGRARKVQPNLPMFLLQRRRDHLGLLRATGRGKARGAGRGGDAAGSRRRRAGGVQSPRRGRLRAPGHAPPRRVRAPSLPRCRRASVTAAPHRGASLKTTDVYVRDLADAEDVCRARASAEISPMSRTENRARELVSTQALDAGCHLVELCTGRLVTYERKRPSSSPTTRRRPRFVAAVRGPL